MEDFSLATIQDLQKKYREIQKDVASILDRLNVLENEKKGVITEHQAPSSPIGREKY